MNKALASTIKHEPDAQCFVTQRDGHQARVDYRRVGDALIITHTRVPEAIGGRGIAGELVQAVFDHARAQGLKVQPQCSYAEGWLQRHPGYAPMRA